MFNMHNLSHYSWAEVVTMASYISNRVFIRKIEKKTPYELRHGKKIQYKVFKPLDVNVHVE